jgi:hypothetical protein
MSSSYSSGPPVSNASPPTVQPYNKLPPVDATSFDNYVCKQKLSSSTPLYTYEALCTPDAVRVLLLQPSHDFSADIECNIIQYRRSELFSNVDDIKHYDAMSYTWGTQKFTRRLLCNTKSSYLMITPNVDSMLRHLRKKAIPRYLWIDAVCLNQEDTSEKDEQIPLMRDIYYQSRKVRIWLGESEESTRIAFIFLQALVTLPGTCTTGKAVQELVQKFFPCGTLKPLHRVLHNTWFSRRWILPEAASGRVSTVHCGAIHIHW